MTLDEAIKRSKELLNIRVNNKYFFEEDLQAIQLGIEALERLAYLREVDNAPNCSSQLNLDIDKLLLSETESPNV